MNCKPLTEAKREASIREVAAILGLSCRRIQQLCSLGVLPKPLRKGHYDLLAVTQAYSKHQRRKIRTLRAKKIKWLSPTDKGTSSKTITTLQEVLGKELKRMTVKLTQLRREKRQKKQGEIIIANLDFSEYEK